MELWTHQPGEGTSVDQVTELAVPTRKPTERSLLTALRTWLLQDYVPAYCRSLVATRIFRRCYWIDALGIERRTTLENPAITHSVPTTRNRKPQSPLPAALKPVVTVATELEQNSKPFQFYGIILATGTSRKLNQRSSVETLPAISVKESQIVTSSWLETAPSLLKELEHAPFIGLYNPLAPQLFSAEELQPLTQRTVPTELLLYLPHKQIIQTLQQAQRSSQQASTLTSLLRTDRWKTLPLSEAEQESAIHGFIDLFITSLQRHFTLPPQALHFPTIIGPARVAAAPFTLLFATRRQDSLICMNDALCRYQRQCESESYRGTLSELWFQQQQRLHQQKALEQLQQYIMQQGSSIRRVRWPDLRQSALIDHYGQFLLQEYDTIILNLLQHNEVHCSWRTKTAGSQEERIPGNDDTLSWHAVKKQS